MVRNTKSTQDRIGKNIVNERAMEKVKTLDDAIAEINKQFEKMGRTAKLSINSTEREISQAFEDISKHEKEEARKNIARIKEESRLLKEEHERALAYLKEKNTLEKKNADIVSQTRLLQDKLKKELNDITLKLDVLLETAPKRTKKEGLIKKSSREYPQLVALRKKQIELTEKLELEKQTGILKEQQRKEELKKEADKRYHELIRQEEEAYDAKLKAINTLSDKEKRESFHQSTIRSGIYALEQKQNDILRERLEITDYMGRQFNTFWDGFTKASPLLSAPLRLMKWYAGKNIQKHVRTMLTPSKETAKAQLDKEQGTRGIKTPGISPTPGSTVKPEVDLDSQSKDILSDLAQPPVDEATVVKKEVKEKERTNATIRAQNETEDAVRDNIEATKDGFNMTLMSSIPSMLLALGKGLVIAGIISASLVSILKAIEKWHIWTKTKKEVGDDAVATREIHDKKNVETVAKIQEDIKTAFESGLITKEEYNKRQESFEKYHKQREFVDGTYSKIEKHGMQPKLERELKVRKDWEDKFWVEIVEGSGEIRQKLIEKEQEEKKVSVDDTTNTTTASIKRDTQESKETDETDFNIRTVAELEEIVRNEVDARTKRLDESKIRIEEQYEKEKAQKQARVQATAVEPVVINTATKDSSMVRKEEMHLKNMEKTYLHNQDNISRENTERETRSDRGIDVMKEIVAETSETTPPPISISMPPQPKTPPSMADSILRSVLGTLESIDDRLKKQTEGGL